VSGMKQAMTVMLILGLVFILLLVGTLITTVLNVVLGRPVLIDLPLAVRAAGVLLVLVGAGAAGWTLRLRKPRDMLRSTSVTFVKLLRREPLGEMGARKEPFLPTGPYRWVRNPLYFGACLFPLGLGVALSYVPFLFWGAAAVCWFLFYIPKEERELEALFGESYLSYKRQVPMLFPTGRRFREGR
jgi:protein-S-isoprenylcysteine O-methyltransferase Ste14